MRMNWNNLSIILRVKLGFGLLVTCLLVSSLVTMRHSAEIDRQLTEMTSQAAPLVLQTNKISVSLLSSDKYLKDILIATTDEDITAAFDNFSQLDDRFTSDLEQLQQMTIRYPAIASLLEPLHSLDNSYFAVGQQIYQQRSLILEDGKQVTAGKAMYQVMLTQLKKNITYSANNLNDEFIDYAANTVLENIAVLESNTYNALTSSELEDIDSGIENNELSLESFNDAMETLISEIPTLEGAIGYSLKQFIRHTAEADGVLHRYRDLVVRQQQLNQQARQAAVAVEQGIAVLEQVDQLAQQEVNRSAGHVSQALASAKVVSIVLLVVSLLLALVVAFSVSASIRKPLKQLLAVLNAAVDGDMTRKVEYRSRNEFGQLASSTNQLLAQTRQVLTQLAEASSSLSNVARGNLITAESTCKELDTQRMETTSVATAMTEMEQTVREVAQSAAITLEKVMAVEAAASAGRQTMSNNISTTHQLSEKLDQSSSVIAEVEGLSKNIGTILDVISGIAEQTNLLALNAAIEAARAGEQGRGFAVVADEVRNLASKTAQSTGEIQSMIENLQNSTRRAVKVMAECSDQMQMSITQTSDANSAMEEIQGILTQISDMSTHIASAAEQQQGTTQEIASNITRISEISDINYQSVESVTETSNALEELAREQDELVHRFTL